MALSKLLQAAILLFSFFYLGESRSFTIDYERDCFLKDGKEFRYVSGGFHYFRVPKFYWKDRLLKIKAAGVNAVQSYVAWNIHEPSPGVYNFAGDADLLSFIELVNDIGLLLILRPGPYICAERDFGGFPAWLLKNSSIILRSMQDKAYIDAVTSWMRVLLPKVKPYLYSNGGPIISVQVENEYGNIQACDLAYLKYLQNLFEEILGKNVILFTVNPVHSKIWCGTISSLFTTVDFGLGTNITAAIETLRKYQPHGPFVNTEYYTGWLDNWGLPHNTKDPKMIASMLDQLLKLNASVNMYMFEGGTNFGFTNGANYKWHPVHMYAPQPTSYDYGAPLSEAGDITEMYYAVREVIGKYLPIPPGPVPPSTPKHAYGKVSMTKVVSLADLLSDFQRYSWHQSKYPLTMEQMGFYYGFILYKTAITFQGNATLDLAGVRDRAVVYCDKVRQGVVSRNGPTKLSIKTIGCFNLLILIENQGRFNYMTIKLNDPKGLVQNVTLNGRILVNWDTTPVILNDEYALFSPNVAQNDIPVSNRDKLVDSAGLFNGTIPPMPGGKMPEDSYLLLQGWNKGQVYINGFNLGRYWPVKGPQVTLYVPATVFRAGGDHNTIAVFELDGSPCQEDNTCYVEFTTTPILNGPTIYN